MLKRTFLVVALGILIVVSESSAGQTRQPETPTINLESLISDAGYKPIKVRDGTWGVSGFSYDGQNLKKLDTFLEVNPNNGLLRISARLGFHDHQDENEELKKTLDSLTQRLKPTEFSLSRQSLFVVIEVPADKLDRTQLVQGMEKAAGEADKAYPDVAKFIIKTPAIPVPGPPSLGPGAGEGVAVGPGRSDPATSESTKVDSKPVLLNSPRPVYTEEARRNKVQGSVLIRLVVDEAGAPTNIRISRGLPDGLDQQAIEAVRKMKFKPAMKDGKAVSFTVTLEVNFKLN